MSQAEAGGFPAVGEIVLVAVGYVIRYVPAPDPEHRGYDLNVMRTLSGNIPDGVVFLRVPEPFPHISQGQPVLLIAEPGRGHSTYVPGECPALQPVDEEDVRP